MPRLKYCHFRISQEMWERVKVFQKGENVSKLFRRNLESVLSGKDRPPYGEELEATREIYRELHSIGVNVNQIIRAINAHLLNSSVPLPDLKQMDKLMREIWTVRDVMENYFKQWHP